MKGTAVKLKSSAQTPRVVVTSTSLSKPKLKYQFSGSSLVSADPKETYWAVKVIYPVQAKL